MERFRIRHYPILTSTSDLLKLEIEEKRERLWDVVVADWQSAGRGRLGRRWESPPGKGLLFSVLMPAPEDPSEYGLYSLLVGLAVTHGIAAFLGAEGDLDNATVQMRNSEGIPFVRPFWDVFALKWPNDLLAEGKKISGVLCEGHHTLDNRQYLIMGIGVNVRHREHDFPPGLNHPATSLYLLNQTECAPDNLLSPILGALSRFYDRLKVEGTHWVREYWRRHDILMGKMIKAFQIPNTWKGRVVDIAADGALVLELMEGGVMNIYSADIQLLQE